MTKRRKIHLRHPTVNLGVPQSKPVRAALLCVDVAANAGWALYAEGRLRAYGEVDTRQPARRQRVCVDAHTTATVRDLPLVLALEIPFGGYLRAVMALDTARVLWRDTWTSLGLPASRILELTATQWRKPLFGSRPLSRTVAREMEAALAMQVACADGCYRPNHAPGADAAAAICVPWLRRRSRPRHPQ